MPATSSGLLDLGYMTDVNDAATFVSIVQYTRSTSWQNEETMLNYYNRTIEPIVSAVVDEMKRKFLTKTARTQGQSIASFRDPFKLVPVKELAEISDKMTRNEIMSSNEIRQVIGMKPSKDPSADQLRNKNLNQSTEEAPALPDKAGQTENDGKKEENSE